MTEELQTCPNCKIGKMRPTGLAATSRDEERKRVTSDFRGYKCDNCGYPEGGQAKVVRVEEDVRTTDESMAVANNKDRLRE